MRATGSIGEIRISNSGESSTQLVGFTNWVLDTLEDGKVKVVGDRFWCHGLEGRDWDSAMKQVRLFCRYDSAAYAYYFDGDLAVRGPLLRAQTVGVISQGIFIEGEGTLLGPITIKGESDG